MDNGKANTLSKKRIWQITGIMLAVVAAGAVLLYAMIHSLQGKSTSEHAAEERPYSYSYETAIASNGMELHTLKTKPSNVTLTKVNNNVSLTPYYGINGGFFYEEALLSIAVVNSIPVNGASGDYGNGAANSKYARGTLVWDGSADQLSVQIVRDASELKVKDNTRFWAQGGISMSLVEGVDWRQQIEAEQAPFADEERLRSAAVFDEDNMVYLVVSSTRGTLASFREAILEKVGKAKLVDGIFLDGDGSSQLRSEEAVLTGDARPVVQMLRIVK